MRKNLIIFILIFHYLFFAFSSIAFHAEGELKVEGGKIWYGILKARRNINNLPIIMIHCINMFDYRYLYGLKLYSFDRDVVFYNQLGSGSSSSFDKFDDNIWRFERFSDELSEIIKFSGYDKVILLAHGSGAAIAADYTLQHPNKVEAMIWISPVVDIALWQSDTNNLILNLPDKFRNALLNDNPESNSYKKAEEYYNLKHVFRSNKLPHELREIDKDGSSKIFERKNTIIWGKNRFKPDGLIAEVNLLNDMEDIKIPVLITSGEYDDVSPETLKNYTDRLQNSTLLIFNNSSKMHHMENQVGFVNTTLKFIRQLDDAYRKKLQDKQEFNPLIFNREN